MRPFPPPPGTIGGGDSKSGRSRRRQDLVLPLPQRIPTNLAVPLPLPPSNNNGAASASTSSQPLDFSALERLNRIGSGAGGTVYKVIHRPSGRQYALKVMYGHHEESVRDQIFREIKILRDVDDPNVVKCHDIYNHSGEIQVLLELMDRGSLEGLHIPNERQLSTLTFQILSGIAYLHSRKIVHRDIKPSNLLVNSRNKVKIADFGVSRVLAQTMDPCNSSVGTIAYMSPERINTDLNHGKYDGYAGDIWSFGVSILEFYLGRFPFAVGRQGDWASLMCAICMSEPPEAPVTASKEFRDFIGCCLQREPVRRWTALQLLRHPFILQHNQEIYIETESSYCAGVVEVEAGEPTSGGLAGLRTVAVRLAGKRRRKVRTRSILVKDKLMDLWHKMAFPVRRLWFAVSTRVKSQGKGAGILKLHDDVQTCGYEDVQVMWEMLRRSESETLAPKHGKHKHRPFWRLFVWSNHSTATSLHGHHNA